MVSQSGNKDSDAQGISVTGGVDGIGRFSAGDRPGSDRRTARTPAQHEPRGPRGAHGAARHRRLGDRSDAAVRLDGTIASADIATSRLSSAARKSDCSDSSACRKDSRSSPKTRCSSTSTSRRTSRHAWKARVRVCHRSPYRPSRHQYSSRRERLAFERLIELVRSRNPYQLDSSGILMLPGFAPIMLAGLDEEQATHRPRHGVMRFSKLDIKVTKLPVRKAGVAALKPFGYDLFKDSSSTFAPVTDVPVPSDYIVGPGDQLDRPAVWQPESHAASDGGPGWPHQLSRARTDQCRRPDLRARGRGHRTARRAPDDRRARQRRDGRHAFDPRVRHG